MAFMETLQTWGGGALNGTVVIVFIVVVVGLIGVVFLISQQRKRYKEYTCIVWFRDGFGQMQQTIDHAGVFIDKKTNNKRLFMQKANVGLSPDEIPFLPGVNGQRYVYLYRKGLKNFFFIRPDVRLDGMTLKVGEEDVNWAVNSYERAKKLFSASTLMQYLPFIALAFVSIIILIMFIYFFKDFKVLGEMAKSLQAAAEAIRAASSGTTIIPS